VDFDPELDDTQMGLPMMLKGLVSNVNQTPTHQSTAPKANWLGWNVTGHEAKTLASTNSNQSVKRKLGDGETEEIISQNSVQGNSKLRKLFQHQDKAGAVAKADADKEALAEVTAMDLFDVLDAEEKEKTEKPAVVAQAPKKLTDEQRIAARLKQITYGKNTDAYKHYSLTVAKKQRKRNQPKTPDPKKPLSKRRFDGMVKKWRKQVALFQNPAGNKDAKPQRKANVNTRGKKRGPPGGAKAWSVVVDNTNC
jgi:hypothetical protein